MPAPKHEFRFRVIEPNGVDVWHVVTMSQPPTYPELRAAIEPHLGGGRLEHVSILLESGRADMFVDEIGVIKRLPRNQPATDLYLRNWMQQHPNDDPASLPYIAGPAVVFDEIVWT